MGIGASEAATLEGLHPAWMVSSLRLFPYSCPACTLYSLPEAQRSLAIRTELTGGVAKFQGEGPMTLPIHPFNEGPSAINKTSCDNLLQAGIVNF